jgi:Family of unknown function (DUF6516)
MKARLLFRDRYLFDNGAIMEMTIWQVPEPVAASTHRLKYSLFYGFPGRRIIGYDNERGKGDHKHLGDRQLEYRFTSVEQLIADFLADVRRVREGDDDQG